MNKQTLTPASLTFSRGKQFRDSFYVREEDGKHWIGHQYGKAGEYHEVRISEDFYNDFLKEKERYQTKYNKLNS